MFKFFIGQSLVLPPQVGGRNIQCFPVFCHGAAGDFHAVLLKYGGDFIVGKRFAWIFVGNQCLDFFLDRPGREFVPVGVGNAGSKEKTVFKDAEFRA